MGTSASSSGPEGKVPLVPSWVPQNGAPVPAVDQEQTLVASLAPHGRFGATRRELGKFARTGSPSSLRGGIASYVGRGLGGASNAARRMGGSALRSGTLEITLGELSARRFDLSKIGLDAATLAGRSTREIIDRITSFVSPSDGTQDEESSKRAVNSALSDLLDTFPNADITSLSEQEIDWVLQRHIMYEIVQRIELDVGRSIVDKAPDPATAIARMTEVREYVGETVEAAFRTQRNANRPVDVTTATRLAGNVISETYHVFEEYIE